jgi:SAM-dependent methyltransferase
MRNYLTDIYWLIRAGTFEALQNLHTIIFDYANQRFAKAHQTIKFLEKKENLKARYQKFIAQKGLVIEQAPYGETPFFSMKRMIKIFEIEPHQTLLELGCGSGKLSFWIASQIGCKVVGIDHMPLFIEVAQTAKAEAGFKDSEIMFTCESLEQASFDSIDVIYFYGTGLGDTVYLQLCGRLRKMKSPPWVITVGGPLSEYDDCFRVMQKVPVAYAWGWTTAYLNTLNFSAPS